MEITVAGNTFSVIRKKITTPSGPGYEYMRTFVNVGRHPETGRVRQIEVAGRSIEELKARIEALLHISPEEAGIISTDLTLDEWMSECRPFRESVLDEQSMRGDIAVYNQHIRSCLGGYRLIDINEVILIGWQEDRLAAGVRNNRIRNAWGVLSVHLDLAVKHRYLIYNPCRFSLIVDMEHIKRDALDDITIRKLLIDNVDYPFYPIFAVMLLCALRISEAIALRWSDLDAERRMLTVHSQASMYSGANGERYIKPYTKGRRPRTICIPGCALWYFEIQKRIQKEMTKKDTDFHNENDLIFTDEQGRILNQSRLQKWFRKCIRESDPDATPHDLRRTGVSRAVEITKDVECARAYLGHAFASTTYLYLDSGDDASTRVSALIEPIMKDLLVKAGMKEYL